MNNPIENLQINPADHDLFLFCHEFIKLNREITNEQIPDSLLEFWSAPESKADKDNEPSDVPLLIFIAIVDLYMKSRKEGEEKLEIGLRTYLFNQFFYTFQVVLSATMHSRKYDIPIEPFQLFMIEKYHIPKIEEPEQLYLEYMRLTQTSNSSCSDTGSSTDIKTSSANQQLEISFPAQSNHLFLIETFVMQIIDHFILPFNLIGKIHRSIIESINYAVLSIKENDSRENVKVIAIKTKKQFKVTILCGEKSLSPKPCEFNPVEPNADTDLKGHGLYLMKNLPDTISFFDDGKEVRLTFNI